MPGVFEFCAMAGAMPTYANIVDATRDNMIDLVFMVIFPFPLLPRMVSAQAMSEDRFEIHG
jgi:hypothetical protein